jgi:hypothetical protein
LVSARSSFRDSDDSPFRPLSWQNQEASARVSTGPCCPSAKEEPRWNVGSSVSEILEQPIQFFFAAADARRREDLNLNPPIGKELDFPMLA